ncbi:alpha/beta hydrolase [Rhodococcus sp. SGAir0479]|uniref:alpha/beta hydrolase n=1 Tax=Rhodococcus sp. SGAir0479 TaxID=2567884 RepID=UPI0010CCB8E2|nr:alpha/beta fold hydrolase [Rhodococcus sp. SGAir0479]QCQ90363.1 alpha/beta fold hydrolase [Rhodococcus sp. SGAir0479]
MPFLAGATGQIHYRRWPLTGGRAPRAGVVFLHGMGQHTGHYHRFAAGLAAHGIELWGLDQAGHGLSEGTPGVPGALADLADDAARLTDVAAADRPELPLVVMGHSLGAAVTITLLRRSRLPFRAAVLCGTPKSVVHHAGTADFAHPGFPVLAIHGVDDRLAPVDGVRAWTAGLPGVTLREYPDTGHDLLHEKIHRTVTNDVAEFALGVTVT